MNERSEAEQQGVRRRLSHSTVVAYLALFVALGGAGAWAAAEITAKDIAKNAVRAKHIKKNQVKTKHLVNNAVRTPKIRNGAVTEAKLAGGVTVSGPQGPQGEQGPPGPFPTSNLPSGVTLRGAFRVGGGAPAAAAVAQGGYSFAFPLASEPTANFLPEGSMPTADCPGSVANPEAAPGHLCLYEKFASPNTQNQSISNPVTNSAPGASRFGFGYGIQAVAAGNFVSVGTWAVTAP